MQNGLNRAASLLAVCAASIAVPCFGQNNVDFSPTTTQTSAPNARNVYSIDVNNDGKPDLVISSINIPNVVSVFLSNGDGTFRQSYSYSFSTQYQSEIPVALGDFNGDGKADMIVELAGFNQLAYFAGNGDGTFAAPVYETIALPSGQIFGGEELAVADYNGDGKVDLVTNANGPSLNNLVLIPGDGTGHFGTAKVIYTAPTNHGPGWSIKAGDFDADGKADVAFSESTSCSQGGCTAGVVHVMFGDGTGNFSDTTPYSTSGYVLTFNAGDLNNDGHTDIVGLDGGTGNQVIMLYGQSDRTMQLYTMSTGLSTGSLLQIPVIGDFNGDQAADIVSVGMDHASGAHVIMSYVGNNTPGTFTPQQLNVNQGTNTDPVAGDFNRDNKPDIAWILNTSSGAQIVAERNGTPQGTWTGGPLYPASGQGINGTAVTSSTSNSAAFHAAASSFGKIRKLELWVDGKKLGEQWHDWGDHYAFFNMTTTSLAAGNHTGTWYAADVDNRLQKTTFGFSVGSSSGGSGCAAPSSAGVNVCKPANGSTVGSPTEVQATATITGTLARMEVWVDGTKMYSETASTSFDTSLNLAAGYHRFDIYAVNTAGTKWETTVYATVSTTSGGGSCTAPSSAGVHVCSPVNGSTVASPVTVTAAATITGTLARMEVWVDGVKKYTETTSTSMSTSIALGAGSHRFDVYAVNTAGTKWETTVYATVN